MNKRVLITVVILLIGLVGTVSVFLYLRRSVSTPPTQQGQQPFGFVNSPTAQRPVPLVLNDNSTVYVADFISPTQPEWATDTSKVVLGIESDAFLIVYFAPDHEGGAGEFNVSLNNEPFGETRRRAESALRAKLDVTNEEMCKLNVVVSTNPGSNDLYKGQNLGFSFCPGAVQLP